MEVTTLNSFIINTAWPMTPPRPYSLFHISITASGIVFAVLAAYHLSRLLKGRQAVKLLFSCGLFLVCSELYKQLFLYKIVNGNTYDWWYFPFQLCSLPMYFCLLLPFLKSKKAQTIICTFMQDFNLLGGIMALAEPSGLMHPYWTLTLHGLIWHILLIFIGLFISYSGLADETLKGYGKTLPLFGACCIIATLINITAKPLGRADMFYISPFYPSSQIVFHQIAVSLGTFPGILIYLAAICAGGLLFHVLLGHLTVRRSSLTSGRMAD